MEAEFRLLKPTVLILVGQMAINRFIGAKRLEDVVGKRFGTEPVMIPLPHPSGQSRWLNDARNRDRLSAALAIVGALKSELALPAGR
jgi:uracil-DNA glycosylase